MGIAAKAPKRPFPSATSFALYSLHSRATLRASASSRNRKAGVVIEVRAVATPAASMSAMDFSGVQSRTGPGTFFATSAARYGGGVWWWWTSIRCGLVVAMMNPSCGGDCKPMRIATPDLVTNSYFPALAAEELGVFRETGFDAHIELLPALDAVNALRDGAVDFVDGGAHTTLLAFPRWRGAKLV